MTDDEKFICKYCGGEFRVKAYTERMVTMQNCPQCYTEYTLNTGTIKHDPAELGCTVSNACKYTEQKEVIEVLITALKGAKRDMCRLCGEEGPPLYSCVYNGNCSAIQAIDKAIAMVEG